MVINLRNWLKELRDNKGLSQEKCAEMVGITQQMLSFIETGSRRPSVETAKALAEVLDFDWQLFYPKRDTPSTA